MPKDPVPIAKAIKPISNVLIAKNTDTLPVIVRTHGDPEPKAKKTMGKAKTRIKEKVTTAMVKENPKAKARTKERIKARTKVRTKATISEKAKAQ